MYNEAKQFITKGIINNIELSTLADDCNKYIHLNTQKSLKVAIRMAEQFVKQARSHRGVLLISALRALGWVLLISGNYHSARDSYLEAIDLAKRDAIMRSRIDRILVDIYMHLGDYKEAKRRGKTAISTFTRLNLKVETAKTRVNLANLYHRQDRHKEAGQQYQKAISFFKTSKDKLSLASCCYNYANTLVQLFDFSGAYNNYKQGEKLFIHLGYDLYVNECRYGLAWMHMLQGNYHEALLGLAECEKHYKKIAQPTGIMVCQLDRAEAYLGLNLWTDARNAARGAEQKAKRLGVHYEAAKAALFFAKASYAVGESNEAQKALKRSLTGFQKENNKAFQGTVLLTSALMTEKDRCDAKILQRARQYFSYAQLPLWEAICDIQMSYHQEDNSEILLRLKKNPAVKTVPHLYASWQTLLGDAKAGSGQILQAKKHWINAIERLESVRAKLPPVELRSAFLRKQSDPYQRMIDNELDRNAKHAAAWSERHKTAGLWDTNKLKTKHNRLRQQAENSLAELAQKVMSLSLHIDDKTGLRSKERSLMLKTLDSSQKQVCYNLARLESPQKKQVTRLQALIEYIDQASKKHPVVQFHYCYPDVVAFVHHQGTTRYYRYENGCQLIRKYMGYWQILLNRVLVSKDQWHEKDLKEEYQLFQRIGNWLWSPLEIPSSQKRVLIIPEGKISNLPWKALIINGSPIVEKHHVFLSPSLRHFIHASNLSVPSGTVEVFLGQSGGLNYSREELSIFTNNMGEKIKVHDPCLRSSIPTSGSARIWHYSGHAELRSDNPFYSSLSLVDGPLFAADLRLKENRVGLVTLAACRTGQQTYLSGEESTGLVRSLLEMGAKNVIASHWAISDKSTALWVREFYNQYLNGIPISEALQQSTLIVREIFPPAYYWAGFSLFGAS